MTVNRSVLFHPPRAPGVIRMSISFTPCPSQHVRSNNYCLMLCSTDPCYELFILSNLIMAEPEDDYLSDKFLHDLQSTSSVPKTYSQRRKEAQRHSKLKDDKNRTKSRLQRELESRQEGLNKSLFDRISEEQQAGIGQGSKALDIMMKMGFKPGQTLGQPAAEGGSPPLPSASGEEIRPSADSGTEEDKLGRVAADRPKHRTVPLPISEELKGSACPIISSARQ